MVQWEAKREILSYKIMPTPKSVFLFPIHSLFLSLNDGTSVYYCIVCGRENKGIINCAKKRYKTYN